MMGLKAAACGGKNGEGTLISTSLRLRPAVMLCLVLSAVKGAILAKRALDDFLELANRHAPLVS